MLRSVKHVTVVHTLGCFIFSLFFFEIKNARVSSDRISVTMKETKNFFSIERRLGGAQLPQSLTRGIFWKICIFS